MQKLTKFKVIFDLFTVCVYFIQQQNCKLYYIYLMIISEIQSEIGHCSCDSAKFKAPADFSHHAILCMTLSLKELWEAYSNHTVRPSVSPSVPLRVRFIYPLFFEVGIPILVCGYITGWRSVAYHFRVTVTFNLTSDLVFRIIVSGAYLLYY